MTGSPPPDAADSASIRDFRSLLEAVGYTPRGIQTALNTGGELLARSLERPIHLRRLAGEGSLETLIRLFLLEVPVEAGTAQQALAPFPVERLEALRLAEIDGTELRAAVRLVPHDEFVVGSDLPGREGGRPDHVAGVHRPSATLGNLTVRQPVSSALDVGTGCGIQALLAAAHSGRVVATDVNERALAFAEFNAALNGVTNIEFRQGDFFDPVRGERFELVVCNPPYVISPESEFLFRDSGMRRDEVSERVVGELPAFLQEGAFATVMASWVETGDAQERPRAWVDGSGCDAWILHTLTEDPLTTAAVWNRPAAAEPDRYEEAVERWLEYFRAEEIEAIAYGAIVLRRRTDGPNWVRVLQLPHAAPDRAGEQVSRLFSAQDYLEGISDDSALLDARFTLVDSAVLEQRLHRREGVWTTDEISLGLEDGIRFTAELDTHTSRLLAALDGTRTLRDVLTEAAAAEDAEVEDFLRAGPALVRKLLELAFVEPRAE